MLLRSRGLTDIPHPRHGRSRVSYKQRQPRETGCLIPVQNCIGVKQSVCLGWLCLHDTLDRLCSPLPPFRSVPPSVLHRPGPVSKQKQNKCLSTLTRFSSIACFAQVVHSSSCLVLVNVSETTKLRLDEGPFVVNVVEIRLSVKSERFHGGGADWTLDTPT